MARYRKVDPRIWNDAKFRNLSDNGKLAFFFLLTHPSMTAIGAMRSSIPGLAAEIGWKEEAFREAFLEMSSKGMVLADEKACVMWLPNFIKYNRPESPNVIKAWVSALEMIPECDLANKAISNACDAAKAMGKGFREALPEAFVEAIAKTMPNQEQEQEQEQEPYIPPTSTPARDDDDNQFSMTAEWKPSAFFETLANTSGVIPPTGEAFNATLGEFKAYWLTQKRKRTQHEWELAFIKAIKNGFNVPKKSRHGPPQGCAQVKSYSVRDALTLQNEEIARSLNEDNRRKQAGGFDDGQAGSVLLEH